MLIAEDECSFFKYNNVGPDTCISLMCGYADAHIGGRTTRDVSSNNILNNIENGNQKSGGKVFKKIVFTMLMDASFLSSLTLATLSVALHPSTAVSCGSGPSWCGGGGGVSPPFLRLVCIRPAARNCLPTPPLQPQYGRLALILITYNELAGVLKCGDLCTSEQFLS